MGAGDFASQQRINNTTLAAIASIYQSSILHVAVGYFPCTLLERPTVIPRVQFQWPIKVLVCTA